MLKAYPPTQPFSQFTGGVGPNINPFPYRYNNPRQCVGTNSSGSCRQALLASPEGRGWVTMWRAGGGPGRLLVSVTNDLPVQALLPQPKSMRAADEAAGALASAAALGQAALAAEHTAWWDAFYWTPADASAPTSPSSSGSFVSLPTSLLGAAKVEQFHWIQVFKMGSEMACRR